MTLRDIITAVNVFHHKHGVQPNALVFNEEPDLMDKFQLVPTPKLDGKCHKIMGLRVIVDDASPKSISAALVDYD